MKEGVGCRAFWQTAGCACRCNLFLILTLRKYVVNRVAPNAHCRFVLAIWTFGPQWGPPTREPARMRAWSRRARGSLAGRAFFLTPHQGMLKWSYPQRGGGNCVEIYCRSSPKSRVFIGPASGSKPSSWRSGSCCIGSASGSASWQMCFRQVLTVRDHLSN